MPGAVQTDEIDNNNKENDKEAVVCSIGPM